MKFLIEIIGLPASGKTYFYNYLKKNIKKIENQYIQIKSLKDFFILEYLKKKTKVSFLKKMTYSLYIKNFKIKSKYLFKTEYKDLNKFINRRLKKDKKYNKILPLYKNYINTTNYTSERKSRILKNFEIDYLGAKFFNAKLKFNIIDEGFFQKIFFNFESMTNLKFIPVNQINYLKLVPNPHLIVLIDTNIKKCFKRSKIRSGGFLYDNKLFKFKNKIYFNKSVINFAKQKKIPIIKLNGASSVNKNIKIFLKKIQKYNN